MLLGDWILLLQIMGCFFSASSFLAFPIQCGFLKQGGASKEDIDLLRRYTFFRNDSEEIFEEDIEGPCGGIIKECGTDSPAERPLAAEDAECCICLSAYENGSELKELPCGHHFHCSCVDKWLYINSTCPLCKYDISKRCSHDGEV